MENIIKLLPDKIANQIAAGEVVQRPASIVKELLENAIDAKATKIKVIVKNAGKSQIQIIDNGIGMNRVDARMAFERHATSKIKNIQDLFAIKTMGFRGEALSSIAAVAQVELKTKQNTDEIGTCIQIEAGNLISQTECVCSEGSSIHIKNLFYNVPARKNFLKSNPVELKHIVNEFLHVALANPEIKMSLKSEAKELYNLNTHFLHERVIEIFGNEYNGNIIPLKEETPYLKIEGFIGTPEIARKKRGEQFFFINNRYIKSPYLNHAIMNVYDTTIPEAHFPFYILFLETDPQNIDINIHPTKTEVKFEDERTVYSLLQSVVKKALFSMDLGLETSFEENLKEIINTPNFFPEKKPVPQEWKNLYGNFKKQEQKQQQELFFEIKSNQNANQPTYSNGILKKEKSKTVWQVNEKYIFMNTDSGLLVIEQKAAQQRILYEKLLESSKNRSIPVQQLLYPQTFHFSAQDFVLLNSFKENLKTLGFDLRILGNSEILLSGVPSGLNINKVDNLIEDIVSSLREINEIDKNLIKKHLAKVIALRGTFSSKNILSEMKMENLVDSLFKCKEPNYSPSGKKTYRKINFQQLEDLFL